MHSKVSYALEAARTGFEIFPITPDRKEPPLVSDFPTKATRDEAQIRAWWERWPDANIGISTTRFGDGEHLLVVDVDNKEGKNGSDEILKLSFQGFDFPRTFTQHTPADGQHLVYRAKVPVKTGTDTVAPGVDTRGKGGYILGFGSQVRGKPYTASKDPIAEAPEWLVAKVKWKERHQPKLTNVEIPVDAAAGRAIFYLEHEAPLAIEGQSGDQTTFKVACRVKDFGVDEPTALYLMLHHWNDRCSPPWRPIELQAKVDHAYQYGRDPVGVAAPEKQFTPIDEADEEEREEIQNNPHLVEFNKMYALILLSGQHYILKETIKDGRATHEFLQEPSFRKWYSNDTIRLYNEEKDKHYSISKADHWLRWKYRRQYDGVEFSPEKPTKPGTYNLWRGFICKPTPMSEATSEMKQGLEMFIEHAMQNVANGNEEHFNWIMTYFAHLIQRPWEKPLTAMVFKGRKGTGKNTLVERVGKLLGTHFLLANSSRFITSNFNGHLDDKLLFVLDEATWGGDKTAEGVLKGLITGDKIQIERKGKETYEVRNLLRIVMIGNEKWLVPATNDERRFAVFQMGEAKMQDTSYFEKMRVLIDERGGNRLLLHYLQTFDLTRANINIIPKTDALLRQKERNLTDIEEWWKESLEEGHLLMSDFGNEWPTGEHDSVERSRVRKAIQDFAKDRGLRKSHYSNVGIISEKFKEMCPSLKDTRDTNKRIYKFPSLETARSEWELYVGHKVDWS
jgi:hypothetical protein